MNVTLTKELESLVQAKVRSGRYADASDVMRVPGAWPVKMPAGCGSLPESGTGIECHT